MKHHVRIIHWGQQPSFSRHSSISGTGEGSTNRDSVALSEEFDGERDHTGNY
jgi:hypothetical protein